MSVSLMLNWSITESIVAQNVLKGEVLPGLPRPMSLSGV